MGKPYSDLEKRAIAILANGGNPATSQDRALANYWQWKTNPSSNAHNLPEQSTRTADRKKDEVYLEPFGVDLVDGILTKVSITKRTNTAFNLVPYLLEINVAHWHREMFLEIWKYSGDSNGIETVVADLERIESKIDAISH